MADRVGGSQTGTPNQTSSFPGAYSDDDPGSTIRECTVRAAPYTFPRPPMSNPASPTDLASRRQGDIRPRRPRRRMLSRRLRVDLIMAHN
ncbi:hypothetical protein F5888DRAFT_1665746 [Russula emetica]|nr:hypothetical protein F5888DRAFT_1665746 [Russula emetica]